MVKIKKSMLFEAVAVLLLLFLIFLSYVMVTTGGPSTGRWTLSGLTVSPGEMRTMVMGPTDELYVLNGEYINAVSPAGKVLWRTRIPNELGLQSQSWWIDEEEFYGGIICLLLTPEEPRVPFGQELVVLTTNGRLLWSKPLDDALPNGQPNNAVCARGGLIYVQSGSNMTAYGRNGVPLWKLSDVYYRWSVGEDGTLYTAPGEYAPDKIVAYWPDGTLKWSYGLENDSNILYDTWQSQDDPIYLNHTLFMERGKTLLALNEDGSLRWKKTFNATRIYMFPLDDGHWSVTMNCINGYQVDTSDLFTTLVALDGSESAPPAMSVRNMPLDVSTTAVANGVIYYCGMATQEAGSLDDLPSRRIDAYDSASGNKLWSYMIMPEKAANTTLNESTVGGIMYQEAWTESPDNVISMNRAPPEVWYEQNSRPYGFKQVMQKSNVQLIPWDGGVYVNYWAYNYEYPFFFDRSRCIYGGGLYALDKNGTLLWEAPTDTEIDNILINNSTVYYSTRAGKLFASTGGAVAGLALTAALYLFIRFLLAGAVTRARGLVGKNNNRNTVLKYIAANPGASLHDVSKGLAINMGTVRYHLMILGINHRIVSFKADDKYVRYFTNASSYTRQQQLIVALMKRDGVRKVLIALLENPGVSNVELSREVGLQESAASRYMKELVEKGVVLKEQAGDGRLSYSIRNEYSEPVAFAMKRLDGF